MKRGELFLATERCWVGISCFEPGDLLLVLEQVSLRDKTNEIIIFSKGSLFKAFPQHTMICSSKALHIDQSNLLSIGQLEEMDELVPDLALREMVYHRQQNNVSIYLGEKLAQDLGPNLEFLRKASLRSHDF